MSQRGADDLARYRTIVSRVETSIERLGPALRAVAAPFLSELAEGEFTQVVVLLPYWLDEVLPLAPRQLEGLATAHLYGWWFYAAQDGVLDRESRPEVMLGGHLALVRMVETYRELGLHLTPCWPDLLALMATSAEGYAQECASRFDTLADLTPGSPATWTTDLVRMRAAAFSFNTVAQLQLAGHDRDGDLGRDLIGALQSFTVARQLADDASDWHTDLLAGRLNVVSARLIRRLYVGGFAATGDDLDIDRLLGHQVTDEGFWATIEAEYHRAAEDALSTFEGLGAHRLGVLLRHQIEEHDAFWSSLRANRAALRAFFAVDAVLR